MRNAARFAALTAATTLTSLASFAAIDKPECIVGAKPGGGPPDTCLAAGRPSGHG